MFRNAGAGVTDRKLGRLAGLAQRNRNFAGESELERVRQEIEYDLLPHGAVHIDRLVQRLAVHGKPEAGLFYRRAEHAGKFGGETGQIHRLVGSLQSAGLNPREIE